MLKHSNHLFTANWNNIDREEANYINVNPQV